MQEAAHQACVAVKTKLNCVQTDLVIVFASPTYATIEALNVIHTILKPRRLVGSSTAGVILSEGVFTRGIGILAVNSMEMTFGIASRALDRRSEPRDAGFEWGRKINADCKSPQHQACFLFTDHAFNNSLFIRGAQEVFGFGVPLLGAISSDNFQFQKVCQFFQQQVLTQHAVGVLISGAHIAWSCKHGFKPLGKPRTITKARSNIIQTIDDVPAIQIYKDYLGPDAEGLTKGVFSSHAILYPLGIYIEEQRQYLLKNAIDILADGSIVCQGDVPEGAEVHLMIGNRDSCRNAAAATANQVKDMLGGRQAKLILIIESAARYKIFRNQASSEILAIKEILGYTTPLIGMYAFGEIVPITSDYITNTTHIQNESITILAID